MREPRSDRKNTLRLRAPAKINLYLEIVDRRPDGYHEIQTVFAALDLADTLDVEPGESFEFHCDDRLLPTDETNLVVKAARLFGQETGIDLNVRISLTKKIPVAAGLGGGSSDAAATLKALNRITNARLSESDLEALGARLGADVPFFIRPGHKIGRGIGEKLSPFALDREFPVLLVNPGIAVSTADAYGKIRLTSPGNRNRLPRSLAGLEPLCSFLRNDLEPVVVADHPDVARIKEFLEESGCDGCLMSGSGPTVFGIYRDAAALSGVAEAARSRGWSAWATRTRADWD